MVQSRIIPSIIDYAGKIADSYNKLKATGFLENTTLRERVSKFNDAVQKIIAGTDALDVAMKSQPALLKDHAVYIRDVVITRMEDLRALVDGIEPFMDPKDWPFPNYFNMLYLI